MPVFPLLFFGFAPRGSRCGGGCRAVRSAAEDFSEGRPLADFERIADGCALKFLKKEKYDDGGCRPFLMYCYYKYAELLNVRIVMSSLNNGLAGDAVKARLRETYEG